MSNVPRDADRRSFRPSLEGAHGIAVIAEVKVASPSRGLLLRSRSARELAQAYERGGAAALSVVTEESRFSGSLDLLHQVRSEVSLPILRKDFLRAPDDIDESARWGASAVLLIARILPQGALEAMLARCRALDLDAVVEVHDPSDLAAAVRAGADIIGVNNRDLQSFEVDLSVSESLAPLIPKAALRISESGISTPADVDRLARAGYRVLLVGESLITAPDPEGKLRELRRASSVPAS